ncbi:MAG TPA: RIO1 family regulatory kinase/ATPase, partial [Bacillota bacterium]|nr:RIO1 family regulatory kinase/ATPase [Bacillota bacterium]
MIKIEVLEKFNSKRNNVYKVKLYNSAINESSRDIFEMKYQDDKKNEILIMKKYSAGNTDNPEREYRNMKMLQDSGVLVPRVIHKEDDSLFFEYIQGELVGDLVERQSVGIWIDEFALWLANLHKISGKSGNLL